MGASLDDVYRRLGTARKLASMSSKTIIRRQTLGDLLRRTAARVPSKPAVLCGQIEWTYAQFDRLCDHFAAGLASHGTVLGDRVAVLARNSHAWAVVRFALARLGAVLVPINFMLNATEVAYILRHSGARILCVDGELAAIGKEACASGTEVENLVGLPSENMPDTSSDLLRFEDLLLPSPPPSVELEGRRLAQIVYTSGTESRPKGAMHTHEAVISEYVSCLVDAEIAHDDLILHALPLYHCAQLDIFLGPGVYVGATHVITAHPTPDNLLALIERHRITSFFAPPTVGSRCCARRFSSDLTCPACQRGITVPRSCPWKYCAKSNAAFPTSGCGICMVRPRSRPSPAC